MALVLPNGPHALTRANVAAYVPTSPGVYILTRRDLTTAFYVNYVGRSDNNLESRLFNHADAGIYGHFKYLATSREDEAFELECRLFHDYGEEKSLDNECHPDRPNGIASLLYNKCPACTLFG